MEDLRKKLLDGEITADTYEKLLRSLLEPPAKNQQIDLLSNVNMQVKDALQTQHSIQRELHVQLEFQRNYKLIIEEQAKRLKKTLDQQNASGSQNPGIASLHDDHNSTNLDNDEILNMEDTSENNISTPSRNAIPHVILEPIDSGGLTTSHVKCHSPKYKIDTYMPESAKGNLEKTVSADTISEIKKIFDMQFKDALQRQLTLQRQLHEQLEPQRTTQLRVEEQARRLKKMFDQHQQHIANKSQNSEITSSLYDHHSTDDDKILSLDDVSEDTS